VNLRKIHTDKIALFEPGFEKCAALVYEEQQEYDLSEFLTSSSSRENLEWKINGNLQNSILEYGEVLELGSFEEYKIEVMCNGIIEDRLLLTVVSQATKSSFYNWYERSLNDRSWLQTLPAPYRFVCEEGQLDPELNCEKQWW